MLHRDPLGGGRLDRVQQGDDADHDDGGDHYPLEHRLVVTLADEPPQPLVLAERRQGDQGGQDDPHNRDIEQMPVALVLASEATFEPQPESQEICQRDQDSVHQQLGKRVAMDRKGRGSDPSAHAGAILVRSPVSYLENPVGPALPACRRRPRPPERPTCESAHPAGAGRWGHRATSSPCRYSSGPAADGRPGPPSHWTAG